MRIAVILGVFLVLISTGVLAQNFDIDINDIDAYCMCDKDCDDDQSCLFDDEKYPHLFETHTKADDYVSDANAAGFNGICVIVNLGKNPILMPLQTDCLYKSPDIVQEEEPECTEDSDCSDGYECVSEECERAPECREDSDCSDGYECISEECIEEPECRKDSDCSDGYECVSDECVKVSVVVEEPEPEPVVVENEPEVLLIADPEEAYGHYEVQCVPVDSPTILASAVVLLGFLALIGWIFYLVRH